jgi:hypothetical protein
MTPTTPARFLIDFPEFRETDPGLIAAKLSWAAVTIDESVYGLKALRAQMLRAAHFLSLAPEGEKARLAVKDAKTVYLAEFDRLARAAAIGLGRNT